MIYCQHLAGMGHLVRCREIIRALVDSFEICFVSGGQMVPEFELPPQVEVVQLPGLWQKGLELLPLDASVSLAETKAQRQQLLLSVFNQFQPDCLMTECFPFSKLSMKDELKPLLLLAKHAERPVRVVCSLRDLIMTQPISTEKKQIREAKIARLVNQYYDAVLFHSDAQFQPLEDCFSTVNRLNCEIFYTGYVAQSASPTGSPAPADLASFRAALKDAAPMIVVSAGGGRHGYPLLSSVIEASALITDRLPHKLHLFAGPFMPEEDFSWLQQAAEGKPNVVLRRYTSALIEYLEKADLSISLGGYNTTMNVLKTGVRSLLLPSLNASQTDEQRIRAEKLARLGILTLLSPEDLMPQGITDAIIAALDRPQRKHHINLQGAAYTANYLRDLLGENGLADRDLVERSLSVA